MQRTFKFRLYPTILQHQKLNQTLDACRWTYNKMVEKIHAEGFQTNYDLNYFLTDLKEQEPWLGQHHSKMLQMISTQVYGAQKALVRLRKNGYKTGKIKFARYGRYNAFTYNQSGFKIENGFLHLSKIDKIKLIQHREFPTNYTIKQITISRQAGKWFAGIAIQYDAVGLPKPDIRTAVGIDVGIKNFAYDSDGYVTPNPLNLSKMLKPLRRVQRKISKRQKGSQNRKKAIKWYQKIHQRIRNRRLDFVHKLSTQYCSKIVFIEELQKLNMMKNHKLARSILDSGWGIFEKLLEYKSTVVKVSAYNTTMNCSRCDSAVPKTLATRTHRCDKCGLVLDRDHNAAINILKKGLSMLPEVTVPLPQELRELTPVEISMRSVKQEEATGLVR